MIGRTFTHFLDKRLTYTINKDITNPDRVVVTWKDDGVTRRSSYSKASAENSIKEAYWILNPETK